MRDLAASRQVSLEARVAAMVRQVEGAVSPKVPFLGMMADEPELMDEIVEDATRARERAAPPEPPVFLPAEEGPSTAESLLKYAGTWEGDDLGECLRLVYETRSKFYP